MEHDGAWQDDKAIYRSHIDAIARAFEDAGVPWPRRRIAIDLRDRSLRRLNEELGTATAIIIFLNMGFSLDEAWKLHAGNGWLRRADRGLKRPG